MDTLTQRLESAGPVIERILSLSGTVGLCYGLLHEGKVVHTKSFGFRDREKKLSVNEETIFPLCSLTKAMVALGVGILVDDGKLSWDTKIREILLGFRTQSEELHQSASILDCLSMRTGMQQYGTWIQSQNNIIFPPSDSLKIINSFQQVQPLRDGFQYDNWAYEIVSQVILNTAGVNWGSFLSNNLFKPLGLNRTGTNARALDSSNVARAYTVLDNKTPVMIPDVQLSDQTLVGAAGGVRSCVADLLKFYSAFLNAYAAQASGGETATANLPFKQVIPITSPHIKIPVSGLEPLAYGMGWVVGRLPGPLGFISKNFAHLGAHVPRIGTNGPSTPTLNHAGMMPGARTAVILFPGSKSAVVVLSNTLGLSDAADTVAQLLTEILFDAPERHDFVDLTQKIIDVELRTLRDVAEQLERDRTPGTTPRKLDEYVGTYLNGLGTLTLDILIRKGKLALRLQGREEETFALEHYEHDIFTWVFSRDECARKGRFVCRDPEYFKIGFGGKGRVIDRLTWKTVSQLPEPEVFTKVFV